VRGGNFSKGKKNWIGGKEKKIPKQKVISRLKK
jgi:hypothetical protein